MKRYRWLLTGCAVLAGLVATGCERKPAGAEKGGVAGAAPERVVVYTALDRQFSEPILRQFTAETGIEVEAVYDTESTKTIGLVNRIRAERDRPRCDVFWNNEILNTISLKREGLLQPCAPAEAENYPAQFRDPEGYWYGFAARARVLIVNTELVESPTFPDSIFDLAEQAWRGQSGIAKPLFGTTASHIACLYIKLGPDRTEDLLRDYKANDVRVLSGNKACAEQVGAGALAFALTDTDDAIIEVEAGRPVRISFPDNDPDAMGTLLLPNTLAVVRGAPHPRAAEMLIDYLLSPAVETMLAEGPSAQIPLNPSTQVQSRVVDRYVLHALEVDYDLASRVFSDAARFIEEEFLE